MTPLATLAARAAQILIVDDEAHNRTLLEVILVADGYVCTMAASGEEALARIAHSPPDLILLDIMMPGIDGYQTTTAIKGNVATRNIPVIMVTAVDERDAKLLGLRAGAEDFLTKPIDRAELRARVRNLLRLKAYGDFHDRNSQALQGEVNLRTTDLVESERLYRSTFEAAPVGIVHVSLTGQWLRVNQRLCDLLGYSRDALQDLAAPALLEPEEVAGEAEALRQMAAGTMDRHVVDEKRYRRHDGSFVWTRTYTSVHCNADGERQHFISVIEDITERRALEAKVRQAAKMDAIGQLASGVAHDFNNLLTVILGFAELLTHDADMARQHGSHIDEIIGAARRAAGLTRQLLAFGRQQVLVTEPVDVNSLITAMTGMLGRLIGDHIHVALALTPDVSPALADRGQLEQVVMNLVVNARDAMPDGGSVRIATSDVVVDAPHLDGEDIAQGSYVMLEITDTGCGMTDDVQRHLFDPFFTTKDIGHGTGLGLSTTYGIVKQSKGHISMSSKPGAGTTFNVYLPTAHPAHHTAG